MNNQGVQVDEALKPNLCATEWMRGGGFGIHVSTVAREIGASVEEVLALARSGVEAHGTCVRLREDTHYPMFENPTRQARIGRGTGTASSLSSPGTSLMPARSGRWREEIRARSHPGSSRWNVGDCDRR